MIRIQKAVKPQILVDNEVQWTQDLLDAIAERDATGTPVPDLVKFRYRHRDIKAAIVTEAFGKCAYCESYIRHTQPGDTEHIVPSSRMPAQAFDWFNLVLTCRDCNAGKHAHPQDVEPIVNPVVDDPSDHVVYVGAIFFPKPGDEKGYLTELVVDLNRFELAERRREKLLNVSDLIQSWAQSKAGSRKKALLERRIRLLAQQEKEYSFMFACFIQNHCGLR